MADSKFKSEDTSLGTGEEVHSGDYITIHYKGTLENGQVFDSSYERGSPFNCRIGVGDVIAGWDMGVIGMKPGGKRKLTIPPQLAYGDNSVGSIPAGSTLIFEVELISID
jgi:peptidylprolyl isomerase